MHKIIWVLSVFLLSLSSVFSQEIRFYEVNDLDQYQQVLEKALEQDQMLFVVIYEEDGALENMIRQGIFKNDSLAAAYDSTIPLAVEITSEMGARLAETFGVQSLPAFYYLTSQELLVLAKSGPQSANELTAALNDARQKAQRYANLQEKFAANTLSEPEWQELVTIHGLNNSFTETMHLAYQYLATLNEQELMNPQVQPILLEYGLDLETKYPAVIIKNKSRIDTNAYRNFYESTYSYNFDRAILNEDTALLDKMVTVLIGATPDANADKARLKFETQKVFAAETRLFNIWKKAAVIKSNEEKNDSLKAEFLFEEAFEIADNFNTPEAQQAARLLSAEAGAVNPSFRYKMLEAYMAYLLKDFTQASALVDSATALTTAENSLRKASHLKKMIEKEVTKTEIEE